MAETLKLDQIRIDGGTQPRAEIDYGTVDEYAADLDAGAKFPPVEVYTDGAMWWLVDGFHRYHAHRKAGRETIEAVVKQGTLDEAIWASLAANKDRDTAGKRRTNADKIRAITTALERWPERTPGVIADWIGVDRKTVRNHQAPSVGDNPQLKREGKDGKHYLANRGPMQTVAEYEAKHRPNPRFPENEPTDADKALTERIVENLMGAGEREAQEAPPHDGKGIIIAGKAIGLLRTIKDTDPLREEGLRTVKRWINDALKGL